MKDEKRNDFFFSLYIFIVLIMAVIYFSVPERKEFVDFQLKWWKEAWLALGLFQLFNRIYSSYFLMTIANKPIRQAVMAARNNFENPKSMANGTEAEAAKTDATLLIPIAIGMKLLSL